MMRDAPIPGPGGPPFLGSYLAFRADPLGFVERTAREHGDLAQFTALGFRCVLLNDPLLIQQVLTVDNDRLRKSWDERELETVMGRGLLTNEGEAWRRQRRLIQPAFTREKLDRYGAQMTVSAQSMMAGWTEGERVDLHAEMSGVTLRIVAEALVGADFSQHADVFATALDAFQRQFEAMISGVLPLPLWVPTPGNLGASRWLRRLDAIIYDIIARRRAEPRASGDLLDALLAAQEAGEGMSDRQLRDELITLLLAGHETTAIALAWALMLLAQHRDVEARLLAELRDVLGDRAPTVADVPRLGYAKQVIEEAMRLYPPAWGIGREVVEPIELRGHRIARGTQIFLAQWVTHRDARYFEDPLTFRPERFAPDAQASIPKFAYFPFGGGQRRCVGAHFAMLEATLLLAAISQRHRFELVPDHPIELQPAVTLRPRHGILATVHRRELERADPK